jgi:RHS repeat-associated protein
VASAQDYYPFGLEMPGRTYNSYPYSFNGKRDDKDVETGWQDYGKREYDKKRGQFISVDPLTKQYPFYSPYQFAGNMPIAATDLDGKEVSVSYNYATVSKDRTAIEVKSSVFIKVQILNLSAIPDANLDLQNIALNLNSDLSNKLSGKSTSTMRLPFTFKSQGNHVTDVQINKTQADNKDYSVTYNTNVFADVSVVNDISKVDKDAWVFAIVDHINQQQGKDIAGLADVAGGKIAIGDVDYFGKEKASNEGRQLALHETLHLIGATDTYPPNSGFFGTQNKNNVMYFVSPDNGRQLTADQIVQEIMAKTVGGIWEVFTPKYYKQPLNTNGRAPTQQQLKTFINENGSAAKINNP